MPTVLSQISASSRNRVAKKAGEHGGGLFDLAPTSRYRPPPTGVPGLDLSFEKGAIPLQTSQPASSGIPELDLSLAGGDVPVPQGLPLPEAPEKVGKGKKVLRGLRDIIPIIAKLAQGAQTQQPGFLGALGEQFSRAEAEPFMQALADQGFRKGEADIANIYAQADERGAGAARTDVLTGLDPIKILADAGLAKVQAAVQEQIAQAKRMANKYGDAMAAAGVRQEDDEHRLAVAEEAMEQFLLNEVAPAQRDRVRAQIKVDGARERFFDVRAEYHPEDIAARADAYGEEAREKGALAREVAGDRRGAERSRSIQSRYQATQKDIDSQQKRRDAEYKIIEGAVGTVPQIVAAKKEIDDKYASIFAELEARLGNLRFMQSNPDHQPGEGGGPARGGFGLPGASAEPGAVLPGQNGGTGSTPEEIERRRRFNAF